MKTNLRILAIALVAILATGFVYKKTNSNKKQATRYFVVVAYADNYKTIYYSEINKITASCKDKYYEAESNAKKQFARDISYKYNHSLTVHDTCLLIEYTDKYTDFDEAENKLKEDVMKERKTKRTVLTTFRYNCD